MVKCKNCSNVKCLAAGKQWYCDVTAEESNREAGDGEINVDGLKFALVDPDEEVRCDHFGEADDED